MKRRPNLLDFGAVWRYLRIGFYCSDGRIPPWHAAAHHHSLGYWPRLNGPNWNTGNALLRYRQGWPSAPGSSCCEQRACPSRRLADAWPWGGASFVNGSGVLLTSAFRGSPIKLDAAASRSFPPAVGVYLVKLACERPDRLGRSLSQ